MINFQAFRNIVCDSESDDESQRILFEMSSTLEILSDLLKKEIFGKTDVGRKMARVIAKELIENIRQHSKSTKALVRLKFENDYNIVDKQYGISPVMKKYLERHQQHGFLLLTVSDNGMGIVTTLKEKYDNSYFIPNIGEKLTEMKNKTTGWWIRSGLHPPNWTKYVRVVGRIIPPGKKGSCHEATAEVQPRVQTSSC